MFTPSSHELAIPDSFPSSLKRNMYFEYPTLMNILPAARTLPLLIAAMTLVSCGGGGGGSDTGDTFNESPNGGNSGEEASSSSNVIFSELLAAPQIERSRVNSIEETAFSKISGRLAFNLEFTVDVETSPGFIDIEFHRGIWLHDNSNSAPVLTSLTSLQTERGEKVINSVRWLDFNLDDSLGVYSGFTPLGGGAITSSYVLIDGSDVQEVAYDAMLLPTFNESQNKELRQVNSAQSNDGRTLLEIRTSDFDYGIWMFDQSGITPVAMSAATQGVITTDFPIVDSSCLLQYEKFSRTDFQDFPDSSVGMSLTGEIFFLARLTGLNCENPRQSIVKYQDGMYVELVSTGEQVPQSNGVFSSLRIISVEPGGEIYFEAFLEESQASEQEELYSYWLMSPSGEIQLVSLEGETFSSTDSVEMIAGVLRDQITLVSNIGPLQTNPAGMIAFYSNGSDNKHILTGLPHLGQPHANVYVPGQAAATEAVNIESLINNNTALSSDVSQWSFDSLVLGDEEHLVFVTKTIPLNAENDDDANYQLWQNSSQLILAPVLTAGDPLPVNDSSQVVIGDIPFELLGVHEGSLYLLVSTRFESTTSSVNHRAIVKVNL